MVDGTAGGATAGTTPVLMPIATTPGLTGTTVVPVVTAAVVTLLTLNCVATGNDVNENPLNDSPSTPIGTFELINNEPTIGAAVTGSPEKISVTNLDSCWSAP